MHFLLRSGACLSNPVNSKSFCGGACFRKLLRSLWTPPLSVATHNKNNDSAWPWSTLYNFMGIKHFLLRKLNILAFLWLTGHSAGVAVMQKHRRVRYITFVCRDKAFCEEIRKWCNLDIRETLSCWKDHIKPVWTGHPSELKLGSWLLVLEGFWFLMLGDHLRPSETVMEGDWCAL